MKLPSLRFQIARRFDTAVECFTSIGTEGVLGQMGPWNRSAHDEDGEPSDQEINAIRPWSPYAPPADHSVRRTRHPYRTSIGIRRDIDTDPIDCRTYGGDDFRDNTIRVFEPPHGFDEVIRILDSSPVVILAAGSDCGRDLAADALLAGMPDLTPRAIGPMSKLDVRPRALATHPRSAWRLDLTDLEDIDWNGYLDTLAGLSTRLRDQHSIMVAIMNLDELSGVRTPYGIVAELTTGPNPYGVLGRHLSHRAQAPEAVERWVEFAESEQLLSNAPPAEAVRLCDSIRRAERYWNRQASAAEQRGIIREYRDGGRLDTADGDRCIELLALDAFKYWDDELKGWHDRYQDHPQLKAFQVTVALLPSARLKRVHDAAIGLRERVGEHHPEQQGLAGVGMRLLVEKAMARLADGRATLPRPGFAEAVVRYFWDDWPQHQSTFLTWMTDLAADDDTDGSERDAIADRIGTFAIRLAEQRGDFSFLYAAITSWAEHERMIESAVRLLERAATGTGIGRHVRATMLDWTRRHHPAQLKVVGEVCSRNSFALQHPTLAFTRISHLAANAAFDDDGLIVDGCRPLIQKGAYTGQILDWIERDITSAGGDQRPRCARMFLSIARIDRENTEVPALIEAALESARISSTLVRIWGAVLRTRDREPLGETFRAWMDSCIDDDIASHVLTMFASAVYATDAETDLAYRSAMILLGGWRYMTRLEPDRRSELEHRLERYLAHARTASDQHAGGRSPHDPLYRSANRPPHEPLDPHLP